MFLPYLDEWESYAHAQEHLTSTEQIKLCLKNEVLCKYTRIASYVHARAAPENSFDPSIKGACQAREFPYVSRDLHLG